MVGDCMNKIDLIIDALENCKGLTQIDRMHLKKALAAARELKALAQPEQVSGDTSDGYHTFNELYDFRKAYNAALFNEWAASGKYSVHKSKRHFDGEDCFGGGWFIVVAQLPDGQISNHYEMKDWDKFQLPETDKALFEYDNHTGADVLHRLFSLRQLAQPEQEPFKPDCVSYRQGVADGAAQPEQEPVDIHCPSFLHSFSIVPVAKREWVGLTDDEIKKIMQRWRNGYIDIKDAEQLLKDKNI